MIDLSWFWFEIRGLPVAVAARNCHVAASQTKPRFVVPAQAECRWQKFLQIVAVLAAIEMWRGGELPGMLIVVAVGAVLELHLVKRIFTSGKMTLRAPQRGMLALQRICGRLVFLQTELRRLKTIDAVAG